MRAEETKQSILVLLSEHDYGLTIEEVASILRINRMTASKYLSILDATGGVIVRSVGKAKLHYPKNGNSRKLLKFSRRLGQSKSSCGLSSTAFLFLLLLAFAVLIPSITLTAAPSATAAPDAQMNEKNFELAVIKDYTDKIIILEINGPPLANFSLILLNPENKSISPKESVPLRTDEKGEYELRIIGFVPGNYAVIIKSKDVEYVQNFEVENLEIFECDRTFLEYRTENITNITESNESIPGRYVWDICRNFVETNITKEEMISEVAENRTFTENANATNETAEKSFLEGEMSITEIIENRTFWENETSANETIENRTFVEQELNLTQLNLTVENITANVTEANLTEANESVSRVFLEKIISFSSVKDKFGMNEKPSFRLVSKKQFSEKEKVIEEGSRPEDLHFLIYNPQGELVDVKTDIVEIGVGEFQIELAKERFLRPGLYRLRTTFKDEGETYGQETEFLWGVLAINTHKSIYLPTEEAFIGIAVLDNLGHMVCDADVMLEITGPGGTTAAFSTSDGTIKVSPECSLYGVTNMPDYYAQYQAGSPGTYTMKLTALTRDGDRSMTGMFLVQEHVDFDVERSGPTRIYPPSKYKMTFTIRANRNYDGPVYEYVPSSFDITPQNGLDVTTAASGDSKTLAWNSVIEAGKTYQLDYEFDAPDISPYLFTLGPLEIGEWKEAREWMIASDSNEGWPTFKYDNQRSGNSNAVTGPSSLSHYGNFTAGEKIRTTPVIANGIVYVGSSDQKVYALNASNVSQQLGNFSGPQTFTYNPTVADNVVYIGDSLANFFALNASNVSQQLANRSAFIYNAPLVYNGRVYIGDSWTVRALNASNISQEFDSMLLTGGILGALAIADNTLYVAAQGSYVYALNASNLSQTLSTFTPDYDASSSTPAVVGGVLYIGDSGGSNSKLYARNASNLALPLGAVVVGSIITSPTVANGLVFVGSTIGPRFYALNASNVSQVIGNISLGGSPTTSAVVGSIVYVATSTPDNSVYALNASNISQQFSSYTTGGNIQETSPAIANGFVYIGSDDMHLYVLGTPVSKIVKTNVTLTEDVEIYPSSGSGTTRHHYVYMQFNLSNLPSYSSVTYVGANLTLTRSAATYDGNDTAIYRVNSQSCDVTNDAAATLHVYTKTNLTQFTGLGTTSGGQDVFNITTILMEEWQAGNQKLCLRLEDPDENASAPNTRASTTASTIRIGDESATPIQRTWYSKDGTTKPYLTVSYDDSQSPTASLGTNPIEGYQDTDGSITFDLKCSDNINVSAVQLWGNWSGWSAKATNSTLANNTFWNVTISGIPQGTWKWDAWCNDTVGNEDWSDVNRTFNFNVGPAVVNLTVTPQKARNATIINITANITDSDGISTARAMLYHPNGTFWQNLTMENNSDIYYNETFVVSFYPHGSYNVTIWANDSAGLVNSTEKTWFAPYLNLSQSAAIAIDGSFGDWNAYNVSDPSGDPVTSPASASEDWPMLNFNPNRTSGSNNTKPSSLTLQANFTTGNSFSSSPAVWGGVVYIGNDDGRVYALNASNISRQLGNYSAGAAVKSSPTVASGVVYVGSDDYQLYALNASNISQKLGNFSTGFYLRSSPAVSDGVVYLSASGQLYALNASNISQQLGNQPFSSVGDPAVANGIVYVSSSDYHIYALNASNVSQVLANFTSGFAAPSNPAIAYGRVYIGFSGTFYALNASNISQKLENYSMTAYRTATVANGIVYINEWGFDMYAYALNATNVSQKFSDYLQPGLTPATFMAIANQTLYTSDSGLGLYARNASNISQVWENISTSYNGEWMAIANGLIYVSMSAQGLAAYGTYVAPNSDDGAGSDLVNVSIANNASHLFARIQVNGTIANSSSRRYRVYLGNGSAGSDTSPEGSSLPFNYTHRVQINGSECKVYNYTGQSIGTCAYANGSDTIELSVPLSTLGLSIGSNVNVTFETASSTGRYDIAPDMNSFLSYDIASGDTSPTASLGTNPIDSSNDPDGSITFDLKCSDDAGVGTLRLWGNWTGSWVANQTNSTPTNNSWWNVTVSGIPDGVWKWDAWCNDSAGQGDWSGENRTFTVDRASAANYSNFSCGTTDFNSQGNIASVSGAVLEKCDWGNISWLGTVNASSANLNAYVNISFNFIYLNSSALNSTFNSSANLSFYNLTYKQNPVIRRDGAFCPSSICSLLSYNSATGILLFNVSQFSNYTSGANANLSIWDDTDSQARYPNQNITFYANYTNITSGQPINGTGVYCNISFNVSEYGPFGMTFDTTSLLYEYNRTFSSAGLYNWNVSCNGSAFGYEPLNVSDQMNVTSDNAPIASLGTNPVAYYNDSDGSLTFDLKCSDDVGVGTLRLWGNWTGSWVANQTNSTPANDGWWNVSVSGIPEGTWKWDAWCNDSAGQEDWSGENRTFTVNPTVSYCRELNQTNAVYTMISDVTSSGTCFNITTDNVTLDCNYHEINYSYSGTVGYGVAAFDRNNITVKNCIIKEGSAATDYKYAVHFRNSTNSTVQNNNITTSGASSRGIYLNMSSKNTVANNTVSSSGDYAPGIYLGSSSNNSLINNTVGIPGRFQNSGIDLQSSSSNNTISNNKINVTGQPWWGTYGFGIHVASSSGNNLTNNTIGGGSLYGIYLESSSANNLSYNRITTGNTTSKNYCIYLYSSPNNILIYNDANSSSTNSYLIYGTSVSYFNNSIDSSNLAEGKPVNYTFNADNLTFNNIDFTQYGQVIFAWSRNITITSSNFSDDSLNLFRTSNSTISNNNINTSKGFGIFLYSRSNSNNFSGNTITTSGINGYGIITISSGDIQISTINVNTTNSGAHALNIYSGNNNISVYDGVFNANYSDAFDIYIASGATGGTWNFTNATRGDGSPLNVSWSAGVNGTLNYGWWLDIYANYTNGSAASGVAIESFDNNSVLRASNTTGVGGWARSALLKYTRNNTGGNNNTYYSNYTVNATLSGTTQSQSVNMSTNNVITFTFDFTAPSIYFIPPTDNNSAIISRNWSYVNVSTSDSSNTTGLIDWNRSLVGWWTFNENDIFLSTAIDRSNYSHTATIHGINASVLDSALVATDSFSRADGGLGSNWTTLTGTMAPVIQNNMVNLSDETVGLHSAYWSANSFNSDQYAQAKYPNVGLGSYGPAVAVRLSGERGYILWWGNSDDVVSIWRMDSNESWTELAVSGSLNISNTDVWRLEAAGSSLRGYQNGTLVVETADGRYTGGSPGIWLYYPSNQLDDWEGGNLTVSLETVYGRFGRALAFNGVDAYADAGDIDEIDGVTRLTVAAWIRSTDLGSEKHIVDKSSCSGATDSGVFELLAGFSTPNKAEFAIYNSGGSPDFISSGSSLTSVNDGNWHYILGRYDGSAVTIFVDGNEENSAAASDMIMPSTSGHLQVGGDCNQQGYSSYYFNGTIDDVRIFSRALSAAEINASYSAGLYRLYHNFTNLTDGNYTLRAYAQDAAGNVNSTEQREIQVQTCDVDFNMTYQLQAGIMFAEQDPGQVNVSAISNGDYNVTDNSTSGCGTVNVSVRATGDLVNESSTIGIGNVTVNSTSPDSQVIQLSTDYQLIRSNVPAGTTNITTLYFWLTVPAGQESRVYNTTVYIKEERE